MFRHCRLLAPALLVVSGCGLLPEEPPDDGAALPYVMSFAASRSGMAGATGWQEWSFSGFKKPTRYELIEDSGALVIRASADRSASGLRHAVKVDPASYPVLTWRWKVNELIESADNTRKHTEDSPVRVLVTFDGAVEKVPFADRLLFDHVYLLTGRRMPYATLVYIWENRVATDTVIQNLHTSRIKMIVAESGRGSLGRWRQITRNIVDDYRRAFGEEPGTITSVGIMTDTDNTGLKAEALYGDIQFRPAIRP
jgi:hypothetical protein